MGRPQVVPQVEGVGERAVTHVAKQGLVFPHVQQGVVSSGAPHVLKCLSTEGAAAAAAAVEDLLYGLVQLWKE